MKTKNIKALVAKTLIVSISASVSYLGQPNFTLAVPLSSSPNLIAKANPRQLGVLLIELESNIKWEAVDNKWRSRRDSWIEDLRSTSDPVRIAELLVDLESNIKWEAVDNKWRSRRDGWLRNCTSVSNSNQLSRLIIELESNIKWEAVENSWRSRRDGWIQDVRKSSR